MSKSVHGVLKQGRIELLEPLDEPDGTQVVVTFTGESRSGNFPESGLTRERASDLRARLRTFWEDWDRPEMDVYDRD